jgi:carboxymethylenebutenolidase
MTSIKLAAGDGHVLSAFRSEAAGNPRGGIVVVQEIFGVNAHIRSVAERFSAEGYLAIAPALFDRVEPGLELGYDKPGIDRGRAIAGELDYATVLLDVAAAVGAAAAAGKVGIVGYCWGGAVVWAAAAQLESVTAAVSYYGSRIPALADQAPKPPLMMHVGKHDASFPLDAVQAIGERYAEVVIHEYDAGHGFNCDQRDDFDAGASALAWSRTLAFFQAHVG